MIEIREITAAGKDVAEAKENARAALGASELDDVKFEVLHMGSRGIFGEKIITIGRIGVVDMYEGVIFFQLPLQGAVGIEEQTIGLAPQGHFT